MKAMEPNEQPEKKPFDPRLQDMIEALQHSHVELNVTTKGPTFSVK